VDGAIYRAVTSVAGTDGVVDASTGRTSVAGTEGVIGASTGRTFVLASVICAYVLGNGGDGVGVLGSGYVYFV
jgi:hypothetical protein